MGALAMGDIWYGGTTKNPWNLKQGSSGSSAGSASATSAGLVGFAIGTETWGSIISPSNRCGVTGFRPTYGSVSRHGAMALSWSMDKIGPICRSAVDCALVFNAVRGEDGLDKTIRNVAFNYNAKKKLTDFKIGYIKSYFDADTTTKETNNAVLEKLKALGVEPFVVELPTRVPVEALTIILSAEAAAAFDELTRSNRDSLLVNQLKWAWPNSFRSARFIPAVEYVNATRLRQILIEEYHQATKDFDIIITPTYGGDQLLMTNLTGHPCIVVPTGFNKEGSPVSISFLGKLHGEAALIAIARAYQDATEWDEKVPPLFSK
jgi:Asp-tRNA(Asn)/Glu-tRNA(Gln) amidotransferase A subunit family amidase